MPPIPEPFRLAIDDAAIADLRERLGHTRFPDQGPGEPWAHGTDLDYMRGLVAYWQRNFDWRAQEARLNAFPQYKLRLGDIELHFLHVPGNGPSPCPLLLLHGWPGSVFEFMDLIPRLADPARFGGDAKDALTIIAPSLPGYGLSFAPGQKRFGIEEIADVFRAWSDCGGDVESVFSKDQLLANISLYWFTGAIGSSFWPYYARQHRPWPLPGPVAVPTGYAEFPAEILRPPRSLAERAYADIRRWTGMKKGGHFAAMGQPDALAGGGREFFRPSRKAGWDVVH